MKASAAVLMAVTILGNMAANAVNASEVEAKPQFTQCLFIKEGN